jgi:hypothetical protein
MRSCGAAELRSCGAAELRSPLFLSPPGCGAAEPAFLLFNKKSEEEKIVKQPEEGVMKKKNK